jgi:phosphonate metabolism-associated iron-containing alcohol dehydrogenase
MNNIPKKEPHSRFTNNYIKCVNEYIDTDSSLLILTSKSHIAKGNIDKLCDGLSTKNFFVFSDISPNPEVEEIQTLIELSRSKDFDFIIGLGGGSVIDTCKVLSCLIRINSSITLRNCLLDNEKISYSPIPLIAIPTTAGTGAEVTPFATVWEKKESIKYSFTSDRALPMAAIYDPNLTTSMPFELTLFTALDSISHALESMWNKNNNVISTVNSVSSLRLSVKYLPKLLNDLENPHLRSKLQLASHLSGKSISSTRTAIAHAVSYPLTYKYDVPHGLACSFMLSNIIHDNIDQLDSIFDEKDLLCEVADMLESFNLKNILSGYLNSDELMLMLKSMRSNSRAGNYLFDINDKILREYVL